MWAVLAHVEDAAAWWVFTRFRDRQLPVQWLSIEELAAPDTTWTHEVGALGASVQACLGSDRLIGPGVDAVLNRMVTPPGAALAAAVEQDKTYAQGEITAFAVSWVTALAPVVINPASSQGLSGRWRSALHWRVLASRAGLPVVPLEMDSARPETCGYMNGEHGTTVLSIGGNLLHSSAPPAVRRGAARLAELSGTPVLGVRFAGTDPARSGWRLLDATPHPDLSLAGEAGIDALVGVLNR